MKAPFIYFGGKRRVAHHVWAALGDVHNYVEPFAGSLAVLLERPAEHARRAETVNDIDGMLANFWRAMSHDAAEVAAHADWPVNENDLFARHAWLVQRDKPGLANRLDADPSYYDARVAGWWVWGINAWIGSGWCSGSGCWYVAEDGTIARWPRNRQRPHLGDTGQGINRQRPHLGNAGQESGVLPVNQSLRSYLSELGERLARVRVCCGSWERVVTTGALSYGRTVGVFLDPPYLGSVRTKHLYAEDDHTVANEVREWAIANGDDPRLRIVLAGYEPEHEARIPASWRRLRYSASAAYQNSKTDGKNQVNRKLEMLWFSPHCLALDVRESSIPVLDADDTF